MAERWQQWMPFHIDRFRGSPDVQAMHPIARCGYIYLLTAQWQMADCTLPGDPDSLAALAGLSDEMWEKYGPRILRKFGTDDQGRICNLVLRKEWEEAKRVFKSRQASALRTNTVRSPQRSPSRSADTITLTGTGTTTKTEELKTLALTSVEVPASPSVLSLPLTGNKTHTITEADIAMWSEAYPGVSILSELRKIPPWLDANPDKRSANVKGSKQRIVKWLTRSQNNLGMNKPNGGNGHGYENPFDAARRRIREEAMVEDEDDDAGGVARGEVALR